MGMNVDGMIEMMEIESERGEKRIKGGGLVVFREGSP